MCLFENAKILLYNIKYQSREEARDMIKFFTIRLELAQTSFMLFVESTYFFFAFCWAQEEIPEFLQVSSITKPSLSIQRSFYVFSNYRVSKFEDSYLLFLLLI